MIVSTVLVFICTLLLFLSFRRRRDIPPGPRFAPPLIGNLFSLRGGMAKVFRRMRQEYGDIFSLYMGNRLVIVFNGYRVLKEAFLKHGDTFSIRPDMFFTRIWARHKGITLSNGKVWTEQRRFAMNSLRKLGMGKNVLEERIHEEVLALIEQIEKENTSESVDMSRLLRKAVTNVISAIVFGKRLEYDDPNFKWFLDEMAQLANVSVIINFVTFLQYIPGDPFGLNIIPLFKKKCADIIINPAIKEHKQTYDCSDEPYDFISCLLQEIKVQEQTNGKESFLDIENVIQSIVDIFSAGSETTGTALSWTIIYFLHYPESQKRCYNEIVEIVGRERLPSVHDKTNLPYFEATLLEILRITNIVPTAIPHSVSEDFVFEGYVIPKDTIIIPNLESVLRDEEVWGDPNDFRPERFLDDSGKIHKPDEFLPFMLGKRDCLGESLARMEHFLFMAGLIQRFEFVLGEGESLPSLEGCSGGFVHGTLPFKVKLLTRS